MAPHWTYRALRRRWCRVTRHGERGFGTLEAVIVIPVVIIATMIVVQYVMIYHARNVAEAAARDGLRVARGYQASAAQGKAAAEQYLATVAPKLLANRTCDVQRDATTVLIVCRASVASVVPFGSYSVTERATGPVETFGTVG
jgi:Flp pilus assembly protein TadG